MANAKKTKRKATLLGLGLDSDGHKRITRGDNFTLVGGTKDTHEQMTETAIKLNEKLKARGKQLETVSKDGNVFALQLPTLLPEQRDTGVFPRPPAIEALLR